MKIVNCSAPRYLTIIIFLLFCGTVELRLTAQQIGHAPVEVYVPQPPAPIVALGRHHLVYELHLTHFGTSPATIQQIDVLDSERSVVASWSGRQLWQRIRIIGRPEGGVETAGLMQPGVRVVAYLWITLQPGASAPGALIHRLTLAAADGQRETITTMALPVASGASTIASPVRGGPWAAIRGPSKTSGHRLSIVTLDGRARVPQRFAVDWTLLGDDGLPFHGDRTDVANWYSYGTPVYAVAAGTVALVRDGNPDHPAFGAAAPAVMSAEAAPGNVVVIDIGHGQFAVYAHLKAGSLHVSKGNRVVKGQVVARIGNSGNTLGPHLHFHIGNAAEPLAGEGLPFTMQPFELIGRIASLKAMLHGEAWRSNAKQPSRTVTSEMPLENMVVRFKD
jgi:murein DD-endopeptidase MepM/ murein hydrolase activator NlpD